MIVTAIHVHSGREKSCYHGKLSHDLSQPGWQTPLHACMLWVMHGRHWGWVGGITWWRAPTMSQGGCGGWVGGGWSLSHLLSTRDCSSPGACAWTLPTATSHQYWSVLTLAPPEPVYIHCTTEKGTNGKWSSWGSLMWTHCTVPLVCLVSLVCHSLSLQCLPPPPPPIPPTIFSQVSNNAILSQTSYNWPKSLNNPHATQADLIMIGFRRDETHNNIHTYIK